MKKNYLLFLFVLLLSTKTLFANTLAPTSFTIDNINYTVTSPTTVKVDLNPSAAGAVSIPSTVLNNTITYNVTAIGDNAFADAYLLTSVNIPNSVTTIGNEAFYYAGLTSVTIPNSVITIGDYAFFACFSIISVTIGNSVTTIGDYAFSTLYELTSVNIPNSVTTIGNGAFYACLRLTSITIPNLVTNIEDFTFYACALTTVTIPDSVTTIGRGAFLQCSDLTTVTIPDSVTTIGIGAFVLCDKLTSVTIPNSVTTIGDQAFANCYGLTSVTIGNSVTTIGDYAFYECTGLRSVTVDKATPVTLPEYTFSGVSLSNVDLYVPAGSENDYRVANIWKDFKLISAIAAPTAEATQSFCGETTATIANLTATGTAIKWYASATGGSPLDTTTLLVKNTNYYATQTLNNSESLSRTKVVVVSLNNPLPTTRVITTSGNATFCQGGSVILTSTSLSSASPSPTYTWYRNGEPIRNRWIEDEQIENNGQSLYVYEPGLYTVTVNNGVCNSLPSTVRKVTVNPLPEKPTITTSGSTGLCTGGSVTLTSSSATGNLWSTGANTQSITVSTAGTYSVTATSLGCTSISSEESAPGITVTVATPPARPTITTSRSTTICAGGTVTLTSSVANCKWSTGATTPSITVTNAGSYTVKANNEGCLSSSSLGKTVVVNALLTTPTISVIGSTNLNPGGSVTLTSSSATVNRWSTGATSRSIKVTTAGIYTVMVPGTCSSAWSTGVTVTSGSSQPTRFAETTQKGATSKIAIYPNPSKGVFNVDSDTDGDFYIANQLGQVVKEFKVIKNSANAINVENLSDGLYFVKNLNQNKSNKLIIKK